MGSFVSLDRLGSLSVAKKENCLMENGFYSKGNDVFKPEGSYGPPIYGLGENE